jgi:hypothetical protein
MSNPQALIWTKLRRVSYSILPGIYFLIDYLLKDYKFIIFYKNYA